MLEVGWSVILKFMIFWEGWSSRSSYVIGVAFIYTTYYYYHYYLPFIIQYLLLIYLISINDNNYFLGLYISYWKYIMIFKNINWLSVALFLLNCFIFFFCLANRVCKLWNNLLMYWKFPMKLLQHSVEIWLAVRHSEESIVSLLDNNGKQWGGNFEL